MAFLYAITNRKKRRVKFILYGKSRPIKCSGYMIFMEKENKNYVLKFQFLKMGRKFFAESKLPLKNIRFEESSFEYYFQKPILQEFFKNHIENKLIDEKKINKFEIIMQGR